MTVFRAVHNLLSIALIGLVLSGCQQAIRDVENALEPGGKPPRSASIMDPQSIPDAIPRDEPLARSGNPIHYDRAGARYYTLQSANGYIEHGLATTIPTARHGRQTESGEIYDMFKVSAAHRTLPLPSYARITDLRTQRSVVVRINDRGPFPNPASGSAAQPAAIRPLPLIELSYAAAAKLGVLNQQQVHVRVQTINTVGVNAPAASPSQGNTDTAATAHPLNTSPTGKPEPIPAPTQAAKPSQATAPDKPATGQSPSQAPAQAPAQAPDQAPAQAPRQAGGPGNRPTNTNKARARGTNPLFVNQKALPIGYLIQAGAFQDPANADALVKQLTRAKIGPVSVRRGPSSIGHVYRVQIGPFGNRRSAERHLVQIQQLGVNNARISTP